MQNSGPDVGASDTHNHYQLSAWRWRVGSVFERGNSIRRHLARNPDARLRPRKWSSAEVGR